MALPETFSMGLTVAISIPVKGEIYKNNILQPDSSITLTGTLEYNKMVEIAGKLQMDGMWRRVFGLSYLAVGNLAVG